MTEAIASEAGTEAAADAPRLAKRKLRQRFYLLLAAVDGLAVLLGFTLGNLARFGSIADQQGWTMVAVLLPLFWGLSISSTAFVADVLADWRRGVAPLLGTFYAAVATVLFVSFYLKTTTDISRIMLAAGILFSSGLLVAGRAIVGREARRVFKRWPMSTVLISDGLFCPCAEGADCVDADRAGIEPGTSSPLVLDRLGRLLHDADSVVIATAPERRSAWATALKGVNIRGEVLVPELDAMGAVTATRFAGIATTVVATGPLGARDQMLKRGLDIIIALAAVLFLAPLLALVAVAIKLDSRGPVFFVQQRLGYKNRLFNVFKFRSMRAEQSDAAGARSASRDDDRITRVGRFIRATSVDELPQLFNILHGEMSFVGPRPHALGSLAGDQLFWEVDPRYWHRHACKPGLTGLAQIRGFRGATHRREDLINRLHADLEYVSGWSPWRDLSILAATVKVVAHRNAF